MAKILSVAEANFVNSLLRGRSKREAAISAGYATKSASVRASEMMQRETVRAALAEFYRLEEPEILIAREKIRKRMLETALADPSEAFDDDFGLKQLCDIPRSTRLLIVSGRRWESEEQGSGSAVRMLDPGQQQQRYLKLFPAPSTASTTSLEEAADEFIRESEALMDRLDEMEEEEDGCAT